MALTIHGYRLVKEDVKNIHHIKGTLSVKPYVPAVFKNPKYTTRYPVYKETDTHLFVPKHYGIETFGKIETSTRDVQQTDDKFWNFTGSLRETQHDVVNSFLKPEPHDGIICLQTGGGKTVCALYIASQLKLPTIVLVHNSFLRDQWIERVSSFLPKARIGRIQGDVCEIDGYDVIIAMLQTVSMKEFPPNTFKSLGFVIVDECHHIASEVFSQALPKITSKYHLGLSATPTRKDGLMYVGNWFLGPMLYQSDNGDKVDDLVKVEMYEYETTDVEMNKVIYNDAGVMFTTLMINKLVEHQPRTEFIVDILVDIWDEKGRQILVLSDRVDHLKSIYNTLPEKIRDTACILSRDVNAKTRAEWCEKKRILIATYQMCKEGFDVPTLNTLIIATPRPDVDQIVGRILRVEKSKRSIHPLIVDIVDTTFRRQFQQRNSLYKQRNYTVEKMQLT